MISDRWSQLPNLDVAINPVLIDEADRCDAIAMNQPSELHNRAGVPVIEETRTQSSLNRRKAIAQSFQLRFAGEVSLELGGRVQPSDVRCLVVILMSNNVRISRHLSHRAGSYNDPLNPIESYALTTFGSPVLKAIWTKSGLQDTKGADSILLVCDCGNYFRLNSLQKGRNTGCHNLANRQRYQNKISPRPLLSIACQCSRC